MFKREYKNNTLKNLLNRTQTETQNNDEVKRFKGETLFKSCFKNFSAQNFIIDQDRLPKNIENFEISTTKRKEEQTMLEDDYKNRKVVNETFKDILKSIGMNMNYSTFINMINNGKIPSKSLKKGQEIVVPERSIFVETNNKSKAQICLYNPSLDKHEEFILNLNEKTLKSDCIKIFMSDTSKRELKTELIEGRTRITDHIKERLYRIKGILDEMGDNETPKLIEDVISLEWFRESGSLVFRNKNEEKLGKVKMKLENEGDEGYIVDGSIYLPGGITIIVSGFIKEGIYYILVFITVFSTKPMYITEQTNPLESEVQLFSFMGEVKTMKKCDQHESNLRSRDVGLLYSDLNHEYILDGNKYKKSYVKEQSTFWTNRQFEDSMFGYRLGVCELPSRDERLLDLIYDFDVYIYYVSRDLKLERKETEKVVESFWTESLGLNSVGCPAKVSNKENEILIVCNKILKIRDVQDQSKLEIKISEILNEGEVDVLEIISKLIRGSCFKLNQFNFKAMGEMGVNSTYASNKSVRNNFLQPCLVFESATLKNMVLIVTEEDLEIIKLDEEKFIDAELLGKDVYFIHLSTETLEVYSKLGQEISKIHESILKNKIKEAEDTKIPNIWFDNFKNNTIIIVLIDEGTKFLRNFSNIFKLKESKLEASYPEIEIDSNGIMKFEEGSMSGSFVSVPVCTLSFATVQYMMQRDLTNTTLHVFSSRNTSPVSSLPLRPQFVENIVLGFEFIESDEAEENWNGLLVKYREGFINCQSALQDFGVWLTKQYRGIIFIIRTVFCVMEGVKLGNDLVRIGFSRQWRSSTITSTSKKLEVRVRGGKMKIEVFCRLGMQKKNNLYMQIGSSLAK